jgi:thiamine pyrophosphate-dependent acetolactate synthase large subunit-like protein
MIAAPSPMTFGKKLPSDPDSLDAAVEDILKHIEISVKPVIVAGPKLRVANAVEKFESFAQAMQCGVASSPDSKGIFSEEHPQYVISLSNSFFFTYADSINCFLILSFFSILDGNLLVRNFFSSCISSCRIS